jgi:hypothetical protein
MIIRNNITREYNSSSDRGCGRSWYYDGILYSYLYRYSSLENNSLWSFINFAFELKQRSYIMSVCVNNIMGMKKINAVSLRITSHSPDVLITISYTRAVTG